MFCTRPHVTALSSQSSLLRYTLALTVSPHVSVCLSVPLGHMGHAPLNCEKIRIWPKMKPYREVVPMENH